MRYSAGVLIALLIAGCEGRNEVIIPARISIPGAVTLAPGQSVQVPEYGLIATFDSVTADSRCPLGADCVWAGDGATRLTIQRYNQDAVTCTLHTTLDPKLIAVNGVNIELMELDPVPRLGITLYHWSYTAVFHLDPIYVPK